MSKRKPVPSSSPNPAGPSRSSVQREHSSPAALQSNAALDIETDIPTDEPPIYSGPSTLPISSTRSTPSLQQSLIAGLPDLPWSKYQIPDSTISSDATTITTTHPLYSSDPNALETFLRSQASLPPKPRIRVLGRSDDGLSKDFDISVNMMHYLIQRGGQLQQWNYVQVDNESISGGKQKRSRSAGNVNNAQGDGLRDVVERFCDDKAMVKTFILTRRVVNWNTEYIEGCIRNLLAQISYRGQVTIQFPVQHDKIIVQSPPKGNKFLHGVASLFVENKKYEGVTAVWPYATLAPGGESGEAGERIFAVQSEEAWWKDWKGVVANAVRSKRRGWVSVEDQIELAMTPRG